MTSKPASRVAASVWPWRDVAPPKAEPAGKRRARAVGEAAVAYAVAAALKWFFREPLPAGIVAGVATLILVGGLLVPPLYAGFKRAGQALAKGVGLGLSWLLLVPFFYLCFPLARLLFALRGIDPLRRGYDPAAASYWGPKRPAAGAGRYRKQY